MTADELDQLRGALAENNRKRVELDTQIEQRRAQLHALNRENEALERQLHDATRPVANGAGAAGAANGDIPASGVVVQ